MEPTFSLLLLLYFRMSTHVEAQPASSTTNQPYNQPASQDNSNPNNDDSIRPRMDWLMTFPPDTTGGVYKLVTVVSILYF